jgi:hypothetical protein
LEEWRVGGLEGWRVGGLEGWRVGGIVFYPLGVKFPDWPPLGEAGSGRSKLMELDNDNDDDDEDELRARLWAQSLRRRTIQRASKLLHKFPFNRIQRTGPDQRLLQRR